MIKDNILPNKLKLSEDATSRLRWIKMKTSLPEWTIARLGICYSLGDPKPPISEEFLKATGEKEYNRYTLTGERDLLYAELIRTYKDRFCTEDVKIADLFRGHLNRGIVALGKQVRSSQDLAEMLSNKASAAI